MGIKFVSGGVWKGPVADGNVRIKLNGAWYAPGFIKIKSNGAWVDTGFHGYPNVPINLSVSSWDYGQCTVAWSGPSSGPPVVAYHVEKMNQAGTPVEGYEIAAGSKQFGVSPDTKYQFHVRSKGANGLYSAFTDPLRVGIGHDVSYNYGYVTRQRAWQSAIAGGAVNRDAWIAVSVPDTVVINALRWRNLRTPQSSVVTPGTNRTVNWILNSGDFGAINANLGTVYSGNNTDWGLNNNGNNAAWGIIPRGSGWSTTGNNYYQLIVDQLWCDGTESYQNYEIVSTNPAQGNYYW